MSKFHQPKNITGDKIRALILERAEITSKQFPAEFADFRDYCLKNSISAGLAKYQLSDFDVILCWAFKVGAEGKAKA